jgi:tetratricopeptide (TPR) repeat protein
MKSKLLVEPADTYTLFGECFLEADRLEEAVTAFAKSHAAKPNKGGLHFSLARVEQRRGNAEKALQRLQVCFDEKTADEGTAPYKLLAELLESLDRSDELIERLEKLVADDPDNVPLGYSLAEKFFEADKVAEAETLYRKLIEKAPTVTGYRRLAEIYRKTKRGAALLDVLGEVVDKTGLLETLGDEAKSLVDDKEVRQAVVEAARARQKTDADKLDFSTALAVALLALEAKQFETAAEFFEMALKIDAERAGEIYLLWGMALLMEERAAEAARTFQRAVDEKVLPDDNPAFYFYLAGALAVDDRHDEALAAARKAAKIADDSPRHHARVCWVLYHAKRYDEAIEAYGKLLEKFDDDYASSEIRETMRDARLVLSALCVQQDDLPAAEEWLEQVLDEFPDDVGAANDLGYLWADQDKHLHRAEKMVRYAIEAEPENAAYRDSLGWVYFRQGKFGKAVAELEKAVELEEEPDPVIFDHLGDAYLKHKRPGKARGVWRRAVEAFRKQELADEAKKVEEKLKSLEKK